MIQLKEIFEALHKPIPPVLYHATFKANLPLIKSHGLLPGGGENAYINFENTEPGVYLAETPDEAGSFVESSENEEIPEEWFGQIIIIAIDTTKLDKDKFDVDPNVQIASATDEEGDFRPFIYKDVIPISAFKEVSKYYC